ncbi:MAG: hypothetical protein IJ111_01425 [Eggerthellaceae bacterium]|nr:hypothetical protein [Eggerthellaceae bacterium]
MDESVIKEIGNQLGMGVEQTGEFIQEYLPQYAAMQVALDITYIVMAGIIFAIALAVYLLLLRHCMKLEKDRYTHWRTFDTWSDRAWVVGIIARFFALVLLVLVVFIVPEIIAWSQFPEAKLIDMAIQAVS